MERGRKLGRTPDYCVCVGAIDPIETSDKKKKRTEKRVGNEMRLSGAKIKRYAYFSLKSSSS